MAILCDVRKCEWIVKDKGDKMKLNHNKNNRRTHEQQIWCKDKRRRKHDPFKQCAARSNTDTFDSVHYFV